MLRFCHAFDYVDQPLPAFHVRVFALAEKYFVPGLAKLATDRFTAASANSNTTLEEITDAITDAHNTVYDQGNMLRKAITDVVMLKADTLLNRKCPAFDTLMDSHPSLAADVARAMAKDWKATPDSRYRCECMFETFHALVDEDGFETHVCSTFGTSHKMSSAQRKGFKA